MFNLIDKRTPKLEIGMIVNEYINGKFTREIVINQRDELKDIDTKNNDVVWEIVATKRLITFNNPMFPNNGINHI